MTTDRFRQLLLAEGYQYISADEMGDPTGRAWAEEGKLDKLGHTEQEKLAARVDEQVELLIERINGLLDAGWPEIRVVTDHGWLWLPAGLPKVELPRYLTKSRWARCASIVQEPVLKHRQSAGIGMHTNGLPLRPALPALVPEISTPMVA